MVVFARSMQTLFMVEAIHKHSVAVTTPEESKIMKKSQKGFSLIELLIVVAIILVISAIALPNLLKSRMSANESSAVGTLHTVDLGETTYTSVCAAQGYSATLDEMHTGAICPSGQGLIDNSISVGVKSGYQFTYTPGAPDPRGIVVTYGNVAVPTNVGTTGQRGFYSDQSQVIRYTDDGSAPTVANSPLL